jgi:hypothetical protein
LSKLEEMTAQAYRDVVGNKANYYSGFIARIDKLVDQASLQFKRSGPVAGKTEPPSRLILSQTSAGK